MSKNCGCKESKPCYTKDCACKVFISTDCVTLSEDLTCSNISKGITETEALKQLDAYICDRFSEVDNLFEIENVGDGAEVYKGVSVLGKKQLKTITTDGTISITESANEINLSAIQANQNNFVRQLVIDENSLPLSYTESDIVNYILNLPASERTIAETDSKWNIIIADLSS